MTTAELTITAFDYVVFALSLLSAVGVGIYFAIKDKDSDEETYYFGDKAMSPFPVGMSIALTYISAIPAISFPADTYVFGTVALWLCLTQASANMYACIYFVPLWHRLQLSSMYMYLELRFNRVIRRVCLCLDMFSLLFYFGIVVYLPALAVNAIAPIDLNLSIIMTASICTLYTTVGGMKAVIWTDALQAIIMVSGLFAGLIGGVVYAGGFSNIWSALERGDRLNLWTMDIDPRIRSTFWSTAIGAAINMCSISCMTQSMVQRYLSCDSVSTARWASIYALFPQISISLTALSCGAVAYAVFEGCDPVKAGILHKYDQIMPYLILVSAASVPGIAGLFLAATYSGTLSTISSGLNSISMLFLEEVVKQIKPNISQKQSMFISKITTLSLGAFICCLALVIRFMGSSVISIMFIIVGALKGPMFGLFLLGTFFPWTNMKGAALGTTLGFAFVTTIYVGKMVGGVDLKYLRLRPMYTDQCPVNTSTSGALYTTPETGGSGAFIYNTTDISTSLFTGDEDMLSSSPLTTLAPTAAPKEYVQLFQLSSYYSGIIGIGSTVTLGLLISFLTGANKPAEADPRFFMPLFPGKFWRFGVPPLPEEEYSDELRHALNGEEYKESSYKGKLKKNDNETII